MCICVQYMYMYMYMHVGVHGSLMCSGGDATSDSCVLNKQLDLG